jgi:hypothetical protein
MARLADLVHLAADLEETLRILRIDGVDRPRTERPQRLSEADEPLATGVELALEHRREDQARAGRPEGFTRAASAQLPW